MVTAEFNRSLRTDSHFIVGTHDLILVTGASGFIGARLVRTLLDKGFRNLRCLTRPSSNREQLDVLRCEFGASNLEICAGNLLSRDDCAAAAKDAAVIFHLAAGRGEKSFADAFMNSVVTTRNLLESVRNSALRRFVNVSSLSVYTNRNPPRWRVLDESCPIELHATNGADAYSFAKSSQDQIVIEQCEKGGIPFVIVRPGYVIGPGKTAISGRVGIGTFGLFLHLGGPNKIPFTYVDNCADAIALAGLTPRVEGNVFNVIDDDLPSSRQFLRMYKKKVRRFPSLYVPHGLSYLGCCAWEWYSKWSQGQLDPVFNLHLWHRSWKRTSYSNRKAKNLLNWVPAVSMHEALQSYFEGCVSGRRSE